MRYELRGLVMGMVVGVTALVGFGATQAPSSGPEIGRYRIEVGSDANRSKAYVIDTATGRVWEERPAGFVQVKVNDLED